VIESMLANACPHVTKHKAQCTPTPRVPDIVGWATGHKLNGDVAGTEQHRPLATT